MMMAIKLEMMILTIIAILFTKGNHGYDNHHKDSDNVMVRKSMKGRMSKTICRYV